MCATVVISANNSFPCWDMNLESPEVTRSGTMSVMGQRSSQGSLGTWRRGWSCVRRGRSCVLVCSQWPVTRPAGLIRTCGLNPEMRETHFLVMSRAYFRTMQHKAQHVGICYSKMDGNKRKTVESMKARKTWGWVLTSVVDWSSRGRPWQPSSRGKWYMLILVGGHLHSLNKAHSSPQREHYRWCPGIVRIAKKCDQEEGKLGHHSCQGF